MRNFIEENPWTCILGLIGIVIGAMLPSGLDVLASYDYNQVAKDPAGFLTGYIIGVPLAMMVEVISGLIGGLVGSMIGIFIDGKSNNGGYHY